MPEIEKDIPMPERHVNNRGTTEELRKLMASEIGSSMLFGHDMTMSLSVLATQLGGSGWYSVKKVDNGTRVWKKSEPTAPRARRGSTQVEEGSTPEGEAEG